MAETSSRLREQIEAKYNASIASCEEEAGNKKRGIQQEVTVTEQGLKSYYTKPDYEDVVRNLHKTLQDRLDDVDKECKTRIESLEKERDREILKHSVAPHSPKPTKPTKSRGNSIPQNCDAESSTHGTKAGGKIVGHQAHPIVAPGNKRKAEGSFENQAKRSHVQAPSVSDRADIRKPAHTSQSGFKPMTERTVTFNDVANNSGPYKDTIVEYPTGSRQFYVLYCQDHGVHFTRNPLQGAAKHLDGTAHRIPSRNREQALKKLGYHIVDCNRDLANQHNREVDKAYANGYKPAVVRDRKWKGIENAKPYNIYGAEWAKTRKIYPVMILGWDSLYEAGLGDSTLAETGLLKTNVRPDCYVYDQGKIVNWAPGFEDGGPKVKQREFPVRWFDRRESNGWVQARDLRELATLKVDEKRGKYFDKARSWIERMSKPKEQNGLQKLITETAPKDSSILKSTHTSPMSRAGGENMTGSSGSDDTDSSSDVSVDDDVDDEEDELRLLAERGGDATSDEDYQDLQTKTAGSSSQQGIEAFRKSHYALRSDRTSDPGTRQEATTPTKATEKSPAKATEKSPETLDEMQTVKKLSHKAHDRPPMVSHSAEPQTDIARKSTPGGNEEVHPLPDSRAKSLPTNSPPAKPSSSKLVTTPTSLSKPALSGQASGTHSGNSATAPVTPGSAIHGQKASKPPELEKEATANIGEKSDTMVPVADRVANPVTQQQPCTPEPEQSPRVTQPLTSPMNPTPKMLRGILDFSAGKPLFEISQYADGATKWARANPGDACIQLFCSGDGKYLVSKDAPVNIQIDRSLFSRAIRNHEEEMNDNGDITLMYKDATTTARAMRLVFDQGAGRALGKHQARWFMHWFQDPRFKKSD